MIHVIERDRIGYGGLEWEDLFGKQVMQNAPWEK
jgi:hypothetical protein